MAYQLGYAGGYADEEIEVPPTPVPPVVGGGAPLYRRQWIPRTLPPRMPQPPVRVRVRIQITYRWAARVVRVTPPVKMAAPGPRLDLWVKAVTVHVAERKVATGMEVKSVRLVMSPVAQSRHAWEQRELNEIAVALAALE